VLVHPNPTFGEAERRMQIVAAGEVMELLPVPLGDFRMGSDNELYSEAPAHVVRLGSGFLLGKYPVTQAQWRAVMGSNPSAFRDAPNHPADSVSWDQALDFCRCLSAQSGHRFRLPSEAEWEYACRAGTTGEFPFGPWGPFRDESDVQSEARMALCEYAWFDLNSGHHTHPVGAKIPNPWGLHDMLGNVWEWCADVWHDTYVGAPQDGSPWTAGDERQPRRCLRGGAWDMNAFRCRSAYRSYDDRGLATNRFGFRVAMSAEQGVAADRPSD
jgi:formylglycine-generating enzyme required for sulfatase activity